MKKVLLQLDTDQHPSPFDAIVAHDAGVDVLLSHGSVTPEAVRDLVQGAFFTRAPGEPSLAVWVGGSDVGAGEKILDEVQATFFGPFRVSAMLDSDGCNTTAATAIAMIAKARDLNGCRAVILGVGPVGLRSATLLAQEGCEVLATSIPGDVLGTDSYRRPRGLAAAERLGIDAREPADRAEMEGALEGANIVLAAGPAGIQVLPGRYGARVRRSRCSRTTTRRNRSGSRASRPVMFWPSGRGSSSSARWASAARR